jgi:hypothetical protein
MNVVKKIVASLVMLVASIAPLQSASANSLKPAPALTTNSEAAPVTVNSNQRAWVMNKSPALMLHSISKVYDDTERWIAKEVAAANAAGKPLAILSMENHNSYSGSIVTLLAMDVAHKKN